MYTYISTKKKNGPSNEQLMFLCSFVQKEIPFPMYMFKKINEIKEFERIINQKIYFLKNIVKLISLLENLGI